MRDLLMRTRRNVKFTRTLSALRNYVVRQAKRIWPGWYVGKLYRLLLCTALSWAASVFAQDEILRNPDMEEPFDDDWVCIGCDVERTNEDAYQGEWSARVTNRQEYWGSLSQYVDLEPNNDYYFTAWVKLLNYNGGTMGHSHSCLAEFNYADGETDYVPFGHSPYMRQDRGWTQVGGDVHLARAATQVRVYLQFDDVEVNYLVDTTSLKQVIRNPNWVQEANERINDIRRQDLDIRVVTGGGYDPANVEVEVFMHRHDFAFGSAIVADRISGNTGPDRNYQDVFYENFEWAVFENAMKWRQMEWVQYDINFARVDNALAELRARDIIVRGHCLMWDVEEFVADWLKPMDGEQVRAEIQRRFDYMLTRYEDDIIHWDVNNEQLHGHFFESKTEEWDLMDWMFTESNRQVPDTLLMLNDFSVISDSGSTVAMLNSARELLDRGAPVHGIGVQSHISGTVWPDIISRRLDTVAEAGLPIWVTELDVSIVDREDRADGYETALRLYFSRPEVDGVMIWGFWDQAHWRPDAALWEGPNLIPNAAGERWMQLVKGEWSTYEVLNPTSADQTFYSRAFQGVYSVNIKYDGAIICQRIAGYDVPKGVDSTWTINVEEC